MRLPLFILAFLIVMAVGGQALAADDDSTQVVDTILFHQTNLLDGASPVDNPANYEQRLTQNPTVALFKSMVVPGLGQYGNRRYIKAAVFLGLDVWMVASVIHYGQQASDFKSKFDAATDISERREWYGLYLDRKDERNKFTWFAVIVSFISMFDAYVDAHLSGHPADKHNSEISFDLTPTDDAGLLLSVSVGF